MHKRWTQWLFSSIGCGFLACASTQQRPTHPSATVVAFTDVSVVVVRQGTILSHQTVLVRDQQIVSVGDTQSVSLPANTQVIDGRGKFLIPGLMDMHVHLNRAEDLPIFLAHGVTTVRNMWGGPMHLALRARAARGEILSPNIYTAGPILDGENPVHDGSFVIRTEQDAIEAMNVQRSLGYDFVKVLSKLSEPMFDHVMENATAAGFTVAGHVPWHVDLNHTVERGIHSIEHMTGFVRSIQQPSSPVVNQFDYRSRLRQIDFIDQTRIPQIVASIVQHHVFVSPTRVVMEAWAPEQEVRRRLAEPEMRWAPLCDRAAWEPGPDDPEEIDQQRRTVMLFDHLIRQLNDAGASIVAGTDVGNPLIIPGYSLHRELSLYVRAGLSPASALRTATVHGAALMRRQTRVGEVQSGMQADLVLLNANPLEDIHNTQEINGVMVLGRWHPRTELNQVLTDAATDYAIAGNTFRHFPQMTVQGTERYSAQFEITWRGISFGGERVSISQLSNGQQLIHAQNYDPHRGQFVQYSTWLDGAGQWQRMTLDSDGGNGTGQIELSRTARGLHLQGHALGGNAVSLDAEMPSDRPFGVEGFIDQISSLWPTLQRLNLGDTVSVTLSKLDLGSFAAVSEEVFQVTRQPDNTFTIDPRSSALNVRQFELRTARGRVTTVQFDQQGHPVLLSATVHHAPLEIRRVH